MSKSLPARPNLEQLKHRAKDLLKEFTAGKPDAVDRVRALYPGFAGTFRLHDAQLVIARD